MFKITVFVSAILLFLSSFAFAQGEQDSITITTYYPSPYGVYNELQSYRLAVGDTDNDGGLDAGDQPDADGQLYTARSVIYKPQSALPTSNEREGELVYNSSDKAFHYYDGSAWIPQAGGVSGLM